MSDLVPVRVIPNLPNKTMIVRCQCHLRNPSGEMVQCVRCGCFSHKSCIEMRTPFTCNYCHIASQKILLEKFYRTSTVSGIIIDRTKLHLHLINDKTMYEVCELREHTYACGHVAELLRHLVTYLASLDLSLCRLERHLENPVYEPLRGQLQEGIDKNRKLYVRFTTLLVEILKRYEKAKKKQSILPDFRDAIIQELL